MAFHDVFEGDEPVQDRQPEPWRPPARCPQCHGNQTRLVSMEYEMSVYECEVCGIQFEAEE